MTLGELLAKLTGRSSTPFEEIRGLAYKTDDGSRRGMQRNPRRPDIRDLDSLPFPARDLVDMERYRSIWLERHGYLFDEPGDHPRLPVPLQLVRQTYLGPALQHPQP